MELSDGTLRYFLLVAALLTPRPPTMMVLNEPETSLHPELIPPLAKLIVNASRLTQVWVVSHDNELIAMLKKASCSCSYLELEKELGQTILKDCGLVEIPTWRWPA